MEFLNGGMSSPYGDPDDADFEAFMIAQCQAKIHFSWISTSTTVSSSSSTTEYLEGTTDSIIISSHRLCSALIQDYLFSVSGKGEDQNGGWKEIAKIVGQTMTTETNRLGVTELVPTNGVKTPYFSVYALEQDQCERSATTDIRKQRLLWIKAIKDFAFIREHWTSLIDCLLLNQINMGALSILKEVVVLHVHQETINPITSSEGVGYEDSCGEGDKIAYSHINKPILEHDSENGTLMMSHRLSILPAWGRSPTVMRARQQQPMTALSTLLAEPVKTIVETCDERSIPSVLVVLPFNKYDLIPTKSAVEQIIPLLLDGKGLSSDNQDKWKQAYDRWRRLVDASSSHLYM